MNIPTDKCGKQAMETLNRLGMSVRGWAISNGFSPQLVRDVIKGKRSCRFGKSHQIAVKLGIKNGVIADSSRRESTS